MPFLLGISGNPDGRPKGSRNKTTIKLQEKIGDFLEKNMEQLQEEYDQLSSSEKLKFLINLLPYVMPKPKEMEETVHKIERNSTYDFINQNTPEEFYKRQADLLAKKNDEPAIIN